jgi:hypothetical protein
VLKSFVLVDGSKFSFIVCQREIWTMEGGGITCSLSFPANIWNDMKNVLFPLKVICETGV